MVDAVTPTNTNPRHHVTLSDGSTTVGLLVVNNQGKPEPRAIQRSSQTRTAIKTSSGRGEYDDLELPYITLEQTEWGGGRGLATFEKDTSRYYDGGRVIPTQDGLILGPMEIYTSNYTWRSGYVMQNYFPTMRGLLSTSAGSGNSFRGLYAGTGYDNKRYLARKFTASDTYSASYVKLWLRCVGTPEALTVAIYTNNAGSPDTLVTNGSLTLSASTLYSVASCVKLTFSTAPSLTNGTTYHLVVYGGSTDSSTNHWDVMVDCSSDTDGTESSNGSSWTATTGGRVTFLISTTDMSVNGIFFEYKKGFYFVSRDQDTANVSLLLLCGSRGAADSNSGDKSKLNDSTQTGWTTQPGDYVIITAGPGSEELQPWRQITGSGSGYVSVSPNWYTTHTTSTEYVIVKSTSWTLIHTFSAAVTDVAVAGEFVYFAQGEANAVLRLQSYNNAGTWTTQTASEGKAKANKLLFINHPNDGPTLYGSKDYDSVHGACVWNGQIPRAWGDLYVSLGVLCPTHIPWDETSYTSVTQGTSNNNTYIQIAAGFTTGDFAHCASTTANVDITEAKGLGFYISSNVATADADIDIKLYDGTNVESFDVTAMAVVDRIYWKSIAISPTKNGTVNGQSIDGLKFNLDTDLGAQNITLYSGGVHLLAGDLTYSMLPSGSRIKKLVAYGGDPNDPQMNPWIITEDAVYEVQTQNSDAVIPIPIGEMSVLRSNEQGWASGVNDVYLYFNLGRKLERYYGRNLDDVGPDLDEGLPSNRLGSLVSFVSYPGKVFIAVDGGSSGYSSILYQQGNGWHEYYRAPLGERISGMAIQTIPDSDTHLLWFVQGSNALCVTVSTNPKRDPDFIFAPEGYIESAYIYANMRAVYKVWDNATIFQEFAGQQGVTSALNCGVYLDYRTDNSTTWTAVSTYYDTNPSESADLATTRPRGYKLQYRLRLRGGMSCNPSGSSISEGVPCSPIVKAVVIDAYGVVPNKRSYVFNCLLSEDYVDTDLEQQSEGALGYTARAETALAVLDGWADNATPLTMRSTFSVFDNKTVVLNDPQIGPLSLDPLGQIERHLVSIVLNEL